MGQGQQPAQGDSGLDAQEQQDLKNKIGLSGDLDRADAYLLLKVPDFGDRSFVNTADDRFPDNKLTSFLRLGAFKYADEPPSAKFLLGLIPQTGSPGDPARGDSQYDWDTTPAEFKAVCENMAGRDKTAAEAAGNRDVFFLDDVRKRPQDVGLGKTDDPGHRLSMQERQLESSKLYSRGGWRDHSDGNRLSTTYGDKVEVVRGNYKMIVMGRQDDAGQAQGWEATGCHIQDYAPGTMPGASYWLEWIPDYDTANSATSAAGVWLLCDTTENVYSYARTAGNLREENWGNVHESYVGSENPPPDTVTDPVTKAVSPTHGVAPDGVDASGKPWGSQGHEPPYRFPDADYHLKYDLPGGKDDRHRPRFADDGAGNVRSNPHVIEKTWARRIDTWTGSEACPVPIQVERTFADATEEYTGSESKHVGSQSSVTWADKIDEEIHCPGAITNLTAAGAINERTFTGATATTSVTGPSAETKIGGLMLSTSVVLGQINVDLHGGKFEFAFGARCSIEIGAWYEVKLGPHDSLEVPDKTGTSLKKTEVALNELRTAVNFERLVLNHNVKGIKLKYLGAKIDLGL